MKKYLIALLLCLNFVSIASAEVAEELIALGNVYPGQPFSEVVKMYGQPYESQPYTFGKMYHFFNNGTVPSFRVAATDIVNYVDTRGSDKFSTPNGIKIGSTIEELRKAYGSPDKEQQFKGVSYSYYQLGSNPNPYNNLGPKCITFHIVDGKVKLIVVQYWNR